ncbi:hypothetical protein ES703_14999 [subsurface metagenome]
MKGIIFFWHGPIETIPAGWALCDGTRGTRDLRNFIIIGAGSTYNPGDYNFLWSHRHIFAGDAHEHDIPAGDDIAPGTDYDSAVFEDPAVGLTAYTHGWPPHLALYPIMKLP